MCMCAHENWCTHAHEKLGAMLILYKCCRAQLPKTNHAQQNMCNEPIVILCTRADKRICK